MIFASLYRLLYPKGVEGVELRLDLFSYSFDELARYINTSPVPVLLTHKKASIETIHELLKLEPHYFDLDVMHDSSIIRQYPNTKFIRSYHNFENTPDDLDSIYHSVSANCWGYKIACKANSTNDALRLLLFGRRHPNLLVIAMGEKGSFARVIAQKNNRINFAAYEENTAPGQLSVSEMLSYGFVDKNTDLYGLIGDPVDASRGPLYHNFVFRKKEVNAVYVKMSVLEEELPQFFPLAIELGFKGLSVTMPLKEKVLPYIDEIDSYSKPIGAINTLSIRDGKIFGTNTDGKGALDALGPVQGKKIVLLGAGGAAKAIGYEAIRKGAQVAIFNRTRENGERLAEVLGATTDCAEYDIVINCAPHLLPFPLLPKKTAMDIVYSERETPFLSEAKKVGCTLVYGEEMFYNQAKAQSEIWMRNFHFGKGILQGNTLSSYCEKRKVVVITDTPIHGEPLAKKLGAELFIVPTVKTRRAKENIEDRLLEMGCGRDTILIGVGGGTITDLVGFVASTYMRGIPHIFVPTTLLAMVDAAIGGKTGIDTEKGKNLIGTFYPPKAIIADPNTLLTLPKEEIEWGLAECIKMGLIYDAELLKLPVEEQIERAAKHKLAIVEQDPYEQNIRHILNFGHTIGHAVETKLKIPHGQAVAIGCIAEAHLSMTLGHLPKQEFEKVCSLFRRPTQFDLDLEALQKDKKKKSGQIQIVLINRIGSTLPFDGTYCRPVSLQELEPTILWMKEYVH